MAGIFISYRREDTAGHAGRLFDRLIQHFGKGRVFMDVSDIEPGVDFVDAIDKAVGSCEILIVVIGREWLTCREPGGQRRLENPNDFIRLEAATALKRNIRVIPVLVQGARMPKSAELPTDLEKLSRRQGIEISDTRWDSDTGQLIKALEAALAQGSEAKAVPELEEQRSQQQTRGKHKVVAPLVAIVSLVILAIGGWLLWPKKVEMPRLTGSSLETAEALIEDRGLFLGKVSEQETERGSPGAVLTQQPPAGNQVEKKTVVNLVVATSPKIAVPDVIGKTFEEAKTAMKNAGLDVGKRASQESSEKAPGIVLAQKPAAASRVERAAKVDLVVAVAPKIIVPQIVGKTSRDAEGALREAGLAAGMRTTRESSEALETVLSQRPTAGQVLERGARVDFVVAVPAAIAVPNVVNLPIDGAKLALEKAGLTVGNVRETSSNAGTPGTVLSQGPSAGTRIRPGTRVDLVVIAKVPSAGEIDVPDLRKLPVTVARSKLKEALLAPGKTHYRTVEGYTPGTVFSQRPTPPAKAKTGTQVDLLAVAVPPLYAGGFYDMTAGRAFDLDVLKTADTEVDIRFTVESTSQRYIEVLNGAVIAISGKRPAGRDGCATARLSTKRILVDDSLVNTYICARTNRGRTSEFLPYELVGPAPGTLRIRYLTWQ
jgi:beta-lactam-binding protein with PASTA domain